MGDAILKFKPRESLSEFTKAKGKVSLLRRTGGKKSSPNMAIFGENLASLAALAAGSGTSKKKLEVDVIYIDPPYNVGGNQGYKNTWKGISEKERDWAGDHGAFLDFMEPRLKIGRQLLKDDGVMFLSICDGEYCRIKILMDQIFGGQNCLGTIIWNKTQGAYGKHLTVIHEYILVYSKNAKLTGRLNKAKESASVMIEYAKSLKDAGLNHKEAKKKFSSWIKESLENGLIGKSEAYYSQIHPTSFEPFQATSMSAQDNPDKRCRKALIHPITKKKCKIPPMGWKYSEATLDQMASYSKVHHGDGFVVAGEIRYGKDEKTIPRQAFPLAQGMFHALPTVISIPHNAGKNDLPKELNFATPKPISLIKELLKSIEKKDALILDYFAGSGATAHAVYNLNQEDEGSRSWIMIEEMGSTFHEVLLPRIDHFDENQNYSTFELKTANTGDKSLVKMFNNYSFDFLSAYHQISDKSSVMVEGLNVIGLEEKSEKIVAMAVPTLRKSDDAFIEELATFKDAIKKTKAKSAVIYTVKNEKYEEPWIGLDKSLLSGTSCKNFDVIEIPEQLVQEWNEVLSHMAA